MTATSIRNEKTKILQAIQPFELEDIILGQNYHEDYNSDSKSGDYTLRIC
jgi:hypothetical protein